MTCMSVASNSLLNHTKGHQIKLLKKGKMSLEEVTQLEELITAQEEVQLKLQSEKKAIVFRCRKRAFEVQ